MPDSFKLNIYPENTALHYEQSFSETLRDESLKRIKKFLNKKIKNPVESGGYPEEIKNTFIELAKKIILKDNSLRHEYPKEIIQTLQLLFDENGDIKNSINEEEVKPIGENE